jgi:hypothetical protein
MTAGSAAYGHVCPTVSELNSDQKLIHHAEGRERMVARALWDGAARTAVVVKPYRTSFAVRLHEDKLSGIIHHLCQPT